MDIRGHQSPCFCEHFWRSLFYNTRYHWKACKVFSECWKLCDILFFCLWFIWSNNYCTMEFLPKLLICTYFWRCKNVTKQRRNISMTSFKRTGKMLSDDQNFVHVRHETFVFVHVKVTKVQLKRKKAWLFSSRQFLRWRRSFNSVYCKLLYIYWINQSWLLLKISSCCISIITTWAHLLMNLRSFYLFVVLKLRLYFIKKYKYMSNELSFSYLCQVCASFFTCQFKDKLF